MSSSDTATSHANAKKGPKKGKTPKQLTAWLKHVEAFQKAHPKMTRKTVLKKASKSYKGKSKAKPAAKKGKAGKKPCKTGAKRILKGGVTKRGLTSWHRFLKAMKKEGRTFKSVAARRRAYLAWMKKSGCAKPKPAARKSKAKAHKNAMSAAENQPMSFEEFERVWMSNLNAHANARIAPAFAGSYAQNLVAHPNRRGAAARRVQPKEEDFLIDDEDVDAIAHENARRRRRRGGRRLAEAEEDEGEMELLESEL
jgi:hypothetical protein